MDVEVEQELRVIARLFPAVQSGEKRSTIRWREALIVPGGVAQLRTMIVQEHGRGAYCRCGFVGSRIFETELPPCSLSSDQRLVRLVGQRAGGGKNSAVVRAAGARAVLVDRAALGAQHGAATAFVVTHQQMAAWHARRGKQQCLWNMRKSVLLVGRDVHELR